MPEPHLLPNSPHATPTLLHIAQPNEFLPPIGRWPTVGGLVMLLGFVGAIGLVAILPYKIVVKAPASIRPIGELRLVQAATEGKIVHIAVQANQAVQAGQKIAQIEDARLQTQKRQLQDSITQIEQQLQQQHAQQQAIQQQIAATTDQANRTVASAEADLTLHQRTYQDTSITTVAEMQEAEAALALAQEELNRYNTLAQTGAVAELQIREKEAAVQMATARLQRMKAAINPSSAQIDKAKQQIAQEQARKSVEIARLNQEQAQLRQHQKELTIKLNNDRRDLNQADIELQSTLIRSPISGVVQALTLRNLDQVVRVGETIAQIAPKSDNLVIKAWVASQDIGQVAQGQRVDVRVSACAYPDYGTLQGTVQVMAPDAVVVESQTPSSTPTKVAPLSHPSTYEVTIEPNQLRLTNGRQDCLIQPGMEGQAEIITQEETILQFVLRKARLLPNV